LRENIFDRQRVLSGIQRSDRFPNDIYPKLSLMLKDVNSLINHADFSSERLDYLMDAALGLINIDQTKVTKIFTVVSMFFMPPTMIASIYGMNFVKSYPDFEMKGGFWFAIGLMVLVMAVTYWFFRRKKWL
jgi:magnesium transporter